VKCLIDTNIWLEALLEQEKSEEVIKFLGMYEGKLFAISDFSLHSIILILSRFKEFDTAKMFLEDILHSNVSVLHIELAELKELINIIKIHNIDFDDSYQYYIAKKYNVELISFDKDFDKTDIIRKTLKELI
jgi:predicted nucleic acid-binding protein